MLSFIEEPPFPCRYNRIISVLLGEVQTFLSKESKKRVK
nr:MAG TPA: outer membrane lipoprotein [Caudoviricetes sp.]